MSNIDTSNIDATYPTAGRDNDTEGFRTNFAAIKTGLEAAMTEISELQDKAVLKSQLVDSSELDNDLAGNTVQNGTYSQFYPVFGNRGITKTPTQEDPSDDNLINLDNGPVQKFTLVDSNTSGDDTFVFEGWPESIDVCSSVRLMFTAQSGTKTITFSDDITYETNFPETLTATHGKITVVEAWSVDSGNTIYMHYIGEF